VTDFTLSVSAPKTEGWDSKKLVLDIVQEIGSIINGTKGDPLNALSKEESIFQLWRCTDISLQQERLQSGWSVSVYGKTPLEER
jgi:hypothetical protein